MAGGRPKRSQDERPKGPQVEATRVSKRRPKWHPDGSQNGGSNGAKKKTKNEDANGLPKRLGLETKLERKNEATS